MSTRLCLRKCFATIPSVGGVSPLGSRFVLLPLFTRGSSGTWSSEPARLELVTPSSSSEESSSLPGAATGAEAPEAVEIRRVTRSTPEREPDLKKCFSSLLLKDSTTVGSPTAMPTPGGYKCFEEQAAASGLMATTNARKTTHQTRPREPRAARPAHQSQSRETAAAGFPDLHLRGEARRLRGQGEGREGGGIAVPTRLGCGISARLGEARPLHVARPASLTEPAGWADLHRWRLPPLLQGGLDFQGQRWREAQHKLFLRIGRNDFHAQNIRKAQWTCLLGPCVVLRGAPLFSCRSGRARFLRPVCGLRRPQGTLPLGPTGS